MGFKPKYLGHANLFVRDVERSEKFYTEVLGLHVNERRLGRAVFMSADVEQSHELAVIQLGPDAPTPEEGRVGLNHIAWRMETFDDLKDVYRRLQEKKANIQRIGDHGISLRWTPLFSTTLRANGNESLPRAALGFTKPAWQTHCFFSCCSPFFHEPCWYDLCWRPVAQLAWIEASAG